MLLLYLQRILILFVLSDSAWWGLQNIYTEFWNSLIMQIYANLFKINEKCYFSISQQILILFVLSGSAWWGLLNFYTEFWNSLITLQQVKRHLPYKNRRYEYARDEDIDRHIA